MVCWHGCLWFFCLGFPQLLESVGICLLPHLRSFSHYFFERFQTLFLLSGLSSYCSPTVPEALFYLFACLFLSLLLRLPNFIVCLLVL